MCRGTAGTWGGRARARALSRVPVRASRARLCACSPRVPAPVLRPCRPCRLSADCPAHAVRLSASPRPCPPGRPGACPHRPSGPARPEPAACPPVRPGACRAGLVGLVLAGGWLAGVVLVRAGSGDCWAGWWSLGVGCCRPGLERAGCRPGAGTRGGMRAGCPFGLGGLPRILVLRLGRI